MTFVPARMVPDPIPPAPPLRGLVPIRSIPISLHRPFVPARMVPDPIPIEPPRRPFVPARMYPDPHVIAAPPEGDGRVQRLADLNAFLERLLDEADD